MKNEEKFVENLIVWQRNSLVPKWPATKLAAPIAAATKLQRRKVLFPGCHAQ